MEAQTAKLILLRHAASEWSEQKRFTGHADISLSVNGHEQAKQIAKIIAAMKPCAVVSSDLLRATQTAKYIFDLTRVPITLDSRLREEDVGLWEGKTREEINELFPGALEYRKTEGFEPHHSREGLLSTGTRALGAVEAALEKYQEKMLMQPLVIVSHVNTILALTGLLLNLPLKDWRLTTKQLTPGSYLTLVRNNVNWILL